jgi:hypothetical protein
MDETKVAQELLAIKKTIEADIIKKAQAEARIEQLIAHLATEFSIPDEVAAKVFLNELSVTIAQQENELAKMYEELKGVMPV